MACASQTPLVGVHGRVCSAHRPGAGASALARTAQPHPIHARYQAPWHCGPLRTLHTPLARCAPPAWFTHPPACWSA